jgi:predicted P-loop ATPase
VKHPGQVRDRVMKSVVDMLEALRIRVSMYHADELDVLRKLERPQQFDLAVKIAGDVMTELGHETTPKEPRFDKTRRAALKKHPEGDRRGRRRGVLSAEDQAILAGQKEA